MKFLVFILILRLNFAFRLSHFQHSFQRLNSYFMSINKATYVADSLAADAVLPKLIVFDLDATLWTPELYTLRSLPGYKEALGLGPVADKDVKLFSGSVNVLHELASSARWQSTRLGIASRTNKGPWARSLLNQFTITVDSGTRSLSDLIEFKEIYEGSKIKHFAALKQNTGIEYHDMLFFDDAKDGSFGNCAQVATLGVMAAHCPDGVTHAVWLNAITEFTKAKANNEKIGRVLDAPRSATDNNIIQRFGGARPGNAIRYKLAYVDCV